MEFNPTVLGTFDDFELCSTVYVRILRHHHSDMESESLSEQERAVLFVWYSWGIIDIGSMDFLFGDRGVPDPDFIKTAAAYERIGCHDAAAALGPALSTYSEATRLGHPLDGNLIAKFRSRFVDTDIIQKLAEYIRRNLDAFSHL